MSKKYDYEKLKKYFDKHIFPLNSSSGYEASLNNVLGYIRLSIEGNENYTNKEGGVLTIEQIHKSYEKYIKWWNKNYGNKDYIAKDEKLVPINMFMQLKMYNSDYKQSLDQRFFELFGNNMTEEELFKSYEEFQKEKSIRAKYRF